MGSILPLFSPLDASFFSRGTPLMFLQRGAPLLFSQGSLIYVYINAITLCRHHKVSKGGLRYGN